MISELAREGLRRCTDKGQKMNDTQHRYPIETDTKGKANMEDGEQDKKKTWKQLIICRHRHQFPARSPILLLTCTEPRYEPSSP